MVTALVPFGALGVSAAGINVHFAILNVEEEGLRGARVLLEKDHFLNITFVVGEPKASVSGSALV